MSSEKIHPDETDWLILVYKTSGDEELMEEAREKLFAAGLDEKQIEERFKNIRPEDEEAAFEKAWQRQLERNAQEKYTRFEKIRIFLFGPYEMFLNFNSELGDLREDNYKIKFRQRLLLLIAGTAFWILLFIGLFKYSEYRRMQEIEKVDISGWEKNRIRDP